MATTTVPDLTTPRAYLLLAVADDELITGHRASHWTGVAPSIEEDLAFSTIAQDAINHADLWYQVLLGEAATDLRAAVDELGLGRQPSAYRHAIVCERPPRDFAYTLARHLAYDHFASVRLEALTGSNDPDVAAVATKLRHEERYHLEHADHWFRRLASGDEAHERLRQGLVQALPESLGLSEPPPHEDAVIAEGLLPVGHHELRARWLDVVAPMLEGAGYDDLVPDVDTPVPPEASGGREGHHSDDFTADVWPEMTHLYREHPGARW